MITIDLGVLEYFNSTENEFIEEKGGIVRFEYTLKILYDWEEKWRKPFLKLEERTTEDFVDFCHMMALDPCDKKFITNDVQKLLLEYIQDQPTATTFRTPDGQNANNGPGKAKLQTAEELYALMFEAGIPLEFENRNLNRLLIILKVISSHNSPGPKMSQQDILKQNKSLNAQRKAKMKTKG